MSLPQNMYQFSYSIRSRVCRCFSVPTANRSTSKDDATSMYYSSIKPTFSIGSVHPSEAPPRSDVTKKYQFLRLIEAPPRSDVTRKYQFLRLIEAPPRSDVTRKYQFLWLIEALPRIDVTRKHQFLWLIEALPRSDVTKKHQYLRLIEALPKRRNLFVRTAEGKRH